MSYVERYQNGTTCVSWDEDGNCTRREPTYTTTTHTTGAKITGTVESNNKFTVNGVPVACVDDQTNEQWSVDPSPSPKLGGSIVSISPSTSGSGAGRITTGNGARVTLNGKLIAVVGSTVQTHLGTSTAVSEGNSLLNM
ncbi:hypothetical protein M3629_17490 [Paenibacillus polysaccharolyticus]|uniref:hypothetical protein n=1 Tax=Paenibacillus polysaccharolyticus TaxID=582692 RepID=UPI00203F2A51|nr:hypothetical protein [Paenibacillus polysaccharolyticus]MCM3134586.1 hypothetical protein [Paenibacillus polysaccharolyticus]